MNNLSSFITITMITISACTSSHHSAMDKNANTTNQDNIKTTVTVLPAEPMVSFNDLNSTNWVFVNYGKKPMSASIKARPTLNFGPSQDGIIAYSGKGVANSYNGGFVFVSSGGIKKSRLGTSTMMASENAELNQFEATYLQNMDKVSDFELNGNNLILYLGNKNDKNTETMNFVKR